MRQMLTTLMALFALVLGMTHAGAMASAAHAAPAVATADAAMADMPCHGAMADAAAEKADGARNSPPAPDCCPDGCNGGCAMLAALPAAAAEAPPVGVHGEQLGPGAAPAPDSHGDGLKRPPRLTA
jgi:hypothetical protein